MLKTLELKTNSLLSARGASELGHRKKVDQTNNAKKEDSERILSSRLSSTINSNKPIVASRNVNVTNAFTKT